VARRPAAQSTREARDRERPETAETSCGPGDCLSM
jgi:hypothetical protein